MAAPDSPSLGACFFRIIKSGQAGCRRYLSARHLRHLLLGDHSVGIGFVVAISRIGAVMFWNVVDSTLPFVLRRLGFDPASISTPFAGTLGDVKGLAIYFAAAAIFCAALFSNKIPKQLSQGSRS